MKHIIIVLAAVTGLGAASAPATAQSIHSVDIVAPYEVAAIVRAMGLDPISRPVWRPGRYVLRAIDRRGQELRVVVDARRGEVISAMPLPSERIGGYYEDGPPPGTYEPFPRVVRHGRPSAAWPDARIDEDDEVAGLPPPGVTPRVITAPNEAVRSANHSASIAPSKVPSSPPLPRPRPDAALAQASAPPASTPAASPPPADSPKAVSKTEAGKASSWPPVQPLDDGPGVRF